MCRYQDPQRSRLCRRWPSARPSRYCHGSSAARERHRRPRTRRRHPRRWCCVLQWWCRSGCLPSQAEGCRQRRGSQPRKRPCLSRPPPRGSQSFQSLGRSPAARSQGQAVVRHESAQSAPWKPGWRATSVAVHPTTRSLAALPLLERARGPRAQTRGRPCGSCDARSFRHWSQARGYSC